MTNLFRFIVFFVSLLAQESLFSQIPATDLYVVQLTQDVTAAYHVHTPRLLSQFNSGGYTNQPSFVTENEVYVSVRKAGDQQNDIYAIHLDRETVRQVTKTPQSEYSPTPIPGTQDFACVREIIEDEINQYLFRYPLDQSGNGNAVFNRVPNVGYFNFMRDGKVAMFLVEDPNKLALGDPVSQTTQYLSSNIGRCLRSHPDGSLVYVHKYTESFWYLKKYDLENRRAAIITESLPAREDFCVLDNGHIMMADGSKLYWHPGQENGKWSLISDLSIYGITNISRLAINKSNQLVLVSTNQ